MRNGTVVLTLALLVAGASISGAETRRQSAQVLIIIPDRSRPTTHASPTPRPDALLAPPPGAGRLLTTTTHQGNATITLYTYIDL